MGPNRAHISRAVPVIKRRLPSRRFTLLRGVALVQIGTRRCCYRITLNYRPMDLSSRGAWDRSHRNRPPVVRYCQAGWPVGWLGLRPGCQRRNGDGRPPVFPIVGSRAGGVEGRRSGGPGRRRSSASACRAVARVGSDHVAGRAASQSGPSLGKTWWSDALGNGSPLPMPGSRAGPRLNETPVRTA